MSKTIEQWFDEVTGGEWVWFAKRLAANDTLATGSHQAGPYVPKELARLIFPALVESSIINPDATFPVVIDSHHSPSTRVRVIYYNNRRFGGTRNEFRFTGWGGSASPLLDPESTGSLVILAFRVADGRVESCRVWLCRDGAEEESAENRIGPVEPKRPVILRPGAGPQVTPSGRCRLSVDEMPASWRESFPSGEEIIEFAIARAPTRPGMSVDERLLARRDCEYDVFRSVEEHLVLPLVRGGFNSVDSFLELAQAVGNRRKSRAGRSLELHLCRIFSEEQVSFDHNKVSEGNKRPDFLFPSTYHYRNGAVPADKLRMLAAKTTCKDRWRQILNEADRIRRKHLLTLQEGVSCRQFAEMKEAGVQLVVPRPLVKHYPSEIQPELQTLGEFIEECRQIARELGIQPFSEVSEAGSRQVQ